MPVPPIRLPAEFWTRIPMLLDARPLALSIPTKLPWTTLPPTVLGTAGPRISTPYPFVLPLIMFPPRARRTDRFIACGRPHIIDEHAVNLGLTVRILQEPGPFCIHADVVALDKVTRSVPEELNASLAIPRDYIARRSRNTRDDVRGACRGV